MVLSDKAVGLAAEGATILLLKQENVELHPDQTLVCLAFSSSRQAFRENFSLFATALPRIERDQVGNGDEIVLLGAGEAKRRLYEVKLDPQYWYDKAIERHLDRTLKIF